MSDYVTEMIAGMYAASKGEDCPQDADKSFERGYAAQYELMQINDAESERAERYESKRIV
jgi:hypothetical protein